MRAVVGEMMARAERDDGEDVLDERGQLELAKSAARKLWYMEPEIADRLWWLCLGQPISFWDPLLEAWNQFHRPDSALDALPGGRASAQRRVRELARGCADVDC
jgi:hypothetical protein